MTLQTLPISPAMYEARGLFPLSLGTYRKTPGRFIARKPEIIAVLTVTRLKYRLDLPYCEVSTNQATRCSSSRKLISPFVVIMQLLLLFWGWGNYFCCLLYCSCI